MLTFIFLALFATQTNNEYGSFDLEIDTNTEVSVFIGNLKLEQNQAYKTKQKSLTIEIRYIDGETVKYRTEILDIEPGYHKHFHLKLYANPPVIALT